MRVVKDNSVCSFPCIVSDDGRILVKNLCDGNLEVLLWKNGDYVGSHCLYIKSMTYKDWESLDWYLFTIGGWSNCLELEDLTGIDWRLLKEVSL